MNSMVEILYKNSSFPAYRTVPDDEKKHPGLIVIHEVWGLKDHIKNVADRFATQGYFVLAPDLLLHTGITEKIDQSILQEVANPATRDEAQKKLRAAMAPIQLPKFGKETIERLQECISFLQNDKSTNGKIGVVGFCFGGTYAFSLAAEDKRLNAAVAFYGHAPEPFEKLKSLSSPILAFYGEQDTALVEKLPDLEQAMKKYQKSFQYMVYPNTGHAFFNDTNPTRYNKEAAEDSWEKTLDFLANYLS